MSAPTSDNSETLERIRAAVGPKGWTTDAADMAPHLVDERGRFRGDCAMLVRPADAGEVAAVVGLCAEGGVAIVPQGGNTGLVGASVPFEGETGIVLNLARLDRIRAIDTANDTMTVEAGCILADIQAAARQAGRLFPLSLAAEGSCQIGGNLSTNAGGTAVLRYGNARDLVLGLEVVLPDGRLWEGLKGLRKDNTGYDLKHLFIGAEGTLGVITAAVLKLYPSPGEVVTAFLAIDGAGSAVDLLARLRARLGEAITGFELIPRIALDFVLRHIPATRDPMAAPHANYLLIEASAAQADGGLRERLQAALAEELEAGRIDDAILAESLAQAEALWRLRESISEAQKYEGGSIKHDIAVPVSAIPAFLDRAGAAMARAMPGVRIVAFGHVGDGNLHFNLSQPAGADSAAFLADGPRINTIVNDIVTASGGSISAEHGIGRLKKDALRRYKSDIEIDLMRRVKQALDPRGILNPGKLI